MSSGPVRFWLVASLAASCVLPHGVAYAAGDAATTTDAKPSSDAKTSADAKSSDVKAGDAKSSESKASEVKTADATPKKRSKAEIEAFLTKCSDEADAKGLLVSRGKGAARKAFRRQCMHRFGVDPR